MIIKKPKSNIKGKDVMLRGLLGLFFLFLFIVTFFIKEIIPSIIFLLLLVIFSFISILGFIQYFLRFCVLVAFTKDESKKQDKVIALKIIGFSFLISIIISIIIIFFI
jgi:hypothetical protein